jgi:hypothetical protein
MDKYQKKIESALKKAVKEKSKLTKDILAIEGMSSPKIRHFLNNLVAKGDRYLEIGTWKGSTLISALYQNKPDFHCAIDDWSIFEGGKEAFLKNTKKFLKGGVNFLEGDCFTINQKAQGLNDINIYFYDGGHKEEEQYKAISQYLKALAQDFILIVDDYNWPEVRKGTQDAIFDLNIRINHQWFLPSRGNGDVLNWWNGLYVASCSKEVIPK